MEQYEAFLQEALRLTYESSFNPSVVYPFLERQQDKLNEDLIALIPAFATRSNISGLFNFANLVQQFPHGQRAINVEIAIAIYIKALDFWDCQDNPEAWATIQNSLAVAYWNRLRGERAENIERGIRCFQAALEVFTCTAFPEDWAKTQNNLGTAYCDRIRGERADNIEEGIRYYQAALEVFTCTAFPEDWAKTQNNLGTAYCDRIRGERADNIEEGIRYYQAALEVRTRTAFPEDWARTQNNLGNAYRNRIRGERADNIEEGIRYFQAALEVLTRTAFPQYWATTQMNLGEAYRNRIRGERADNIEEGIRCYQAALEVFTRTAFPEDWAKTQNNLGNAYSNRIRGKGANNIIKEAIRRFQVALEFYSRTSFPEKWPDPQNNLATAYQIRIIRRERANNIIEEAIRRFQVALEVRLRNAFPEDWARAENNLAIAHSNRIQRKRADNIEEALRCFQAALEVYTRTAFPYEWARTQMNLGAAYWRRIRGERTDNIESAIRCFQSALEVLTRKAFPYEWATTQNNLGAAYEQQGQAATAINCYQAALEVYTPSSFPLDCLRTGRNLGDLGYNLQNWEIAIEGYDNAIRAVEQSRDWATNPQTKQQLIADALPLYGRMIQACFQLQRYEQALLTVERSKARTFTELLHNANRLPQNATPDQIQRYQQLNREIAALQYALNDQPPTDPTNPQPGQRSHNLPNPAPQTTPLLTLIQQRKALLAEINDPTFNAFETVKPELPDFSQLLNNTTAILQWFLPQDSDLGAYAFLITHQNSQTHIHPHRYSPAQRQALDQFNQTYNDDYRQNSWYEALDQRLDHLAQLLDLPQLLTHRPNPCDHLILIPHLYLHLFPLHALTIPIQTATNPEGASIAPLQDCFEKGVRYAPSCQILAYLYNRPRPQTTAPFFAIQNPTQDLPYTDVEIDLIRRRFDPAHILKHAAANKPAFAQPTTRAQLENSEIIHFACHGGFNSTNPLNSALILAGDKPAPPDGDRTLTLRDGRRFDTEHQGLTAAEIYRNLKLACRLVILSACETGRLDTRTTDEYIGLANALLYAGSNTVVDTLWCVDDFATAFVAVRFHEELTPNRTIPQALKAAQTWFRTCTPAQILNWCKQTFDFSEDDLDRCQIRLNRYNPQTPFNQRLYWSAFRVNGLE
ncbi:CHAT domain-containing protein [Spirulina subsalsa]|uniref:CHAT domain-containing protein n=1 Tax=Spirulina subsalsa TaxID=54311 RepID=UPI00030B6067|nr:CHAT domain-containing protein [Spirulina subsalsa]